MTTHFRIRRNGAVLAVTLVLAGGAGAAPQKVFRCGPDGRIYSQVPCKDGYEVDADDKRSAEQRRAAEDIVKREEKLNDRMSRERQAKEAAAAKQGPAIIANPSASRPVAPATSAANPRKKRPPDKPHQP
jgi:hypothetical protein